MKHTTGWEWKKTQLSLQDSQNVAKYAGVSSNFYAAPHHQSETPGQVWRSSAVFIKCMLFGNTPRMTNNRSLLSRGLEQQIISPQELCFSAGEPGHFTQTLNISHVLQQHVVISPLDPAVTLLWTLDGSRVFIMLNQPWCGLVFMSCRL